jgi:hypothetical protein
MPLIKQMAARVKRVLKRVPRSGWTPGGPAGGQLGEFGWVLEWGLAPAPW